MRRDKATETKIGIFVLISIVIFVLGIFTISGDTNIFEKKYIVKTHFTNTSGLLTGAYVRLSGVHIGTVATIDFPLNIKTDNIEVHLEVSKEGLERITTDSTATIRTEGLLGAKYVEIIRGTKTDSEGIKDGAYINGFTPPELQEIIGQSEELLSNLTKIAKNLDRIVEAFANEENIDNIEEILHSMRETIEAIHLQEGALHSLIYDQEMAKDLKETVSNLNEISAALNGGDGTLGSLLVDPSIHDSLKAVLGEAERSRFVRAAVKYMLDESKDNGE